MKCSLRLLALLASLAVQQLAAQTLESYQAVVSSQGPANYFTLDGTKASTVDPDVLLEVFGAGGFTFDLFRNPGKSHSIVNQTDFLRNINANLISGGGTSNTTSTASGSVTLLFRTLDGGPTGQRYIFSAGSSTAGHNALALFLESTNVANGDPNSLKFRFGDSTTTIVPAASLAPGSWYYFAATYVESRAPGKAVWYVGRPGAALLTGVTSNSLESVAGSASGLFLGNKETMDTGLRNPGNGHVDEIAIWARELSASEVNAQFAALPNRIPPPASTYQGVVTGQSPNHYFKLDASLANTVPAGAVLSAVGPTAGFTYDFFGDYQTTNASSYTAANDGLVANNNVLSGGGSYNGTPGSGAGTISFLFNSLSGTNVSGQRFLFSAGGATAVTNAFAVFMENWTASTDPGAIKIRLGNSSKAIFPPQAIVPGDWYYCAVAYDESRTNQQVTWYLGQPGGTLNTGTLDFSPGVKAGQGSVFVIGNHTNFNAGWRNPGTGRIDEFAIWHRVLSTTEVNNQFAALASSPSVAQPALAITHAGPDVLISWPASTAGSYLLEATNVLNSTTLGAPSWPSAGTASVVGPNYVVTNAISAGSRFYRLRSP